MGGVTVILRISDITGFLIKITSLTGMSVLAAVSSNMGTRLPFNMSENFPKNFKPFLLSL